jgi:hypothetical protein
VASRQESFAKIKAENPHFSDERIRRIIAESERIMHGQSPASSSSQVEVGSTANTGSLAFSSYQEMLQSPGFAELSARLEQKARSQFGATYTDVGAKYEAKGQEAEQRGADYIASQQARAAMPPPSPGEQSGPGPTAAGPVDWEEMDRETRAKYGLPAKQPLGDIPSGGSSSGQPTSSGTPYLPGLEPEPTPPQPPAGTPPGGPMPGSPPVQPSPVQSPPVQPTSAPEEDATPTPSPAKASPVPGPANAGAAGAWRDLGSAVGYAFGSLGGPLGSSIGMAAGGMLGTVLGGGEVKPRDIAKTTLGLAGGAIAGTVGSKIGSALGGFFGGAEGQAGGGGGGGSTTVSGGGLEGEGGEMIRLLREMSMNIKTMVNDGLYIRGDHRRAGGSII